jgi:hypothetical protein
MPLTQIPLEPPPQSPQGHHPDQGDLFDTTSWDSAYRELHDFPTLLIQTRDELSRTQARSTLDFADRPFGARHHNREFAKI